MRDARSPVQTHSSGWIDGDPSSACRRLRPRQAAASPPAAKGLDVTASSTGRQRTRLLGKPVQAQVLEPELSRGPSGRLARARGRRPAPRGAARRARRPCRGSADGNVPRRARSSPTGTPRRAGRRSGNPRRGDGVDRRQVAGAGLASEVLQRPELGSTGTGPPLANEPRVHHLVRPLRARPREPSPVDDQGERSRPATNPIDRRTWICASRMPPYNESVQRGLAVSRARQSRRACVSGTRVGRTLVGPRAGRGVPGALRRVPAGGCRRSARRARPLSMPGWACRPGVPIGLPGRHPRAAAPARVVCAAFRGVVRDALHQLKYAGEQRLAEPLGAAIARRWARVGVGRGACRQRARSTRTAHGRAATTRPS